MLRDCKPLALSTHNSSENGILIVDPGTALSHFSSLLVPTRVQVTGAVTVPGGGTWRKLEHKHPSRTDDANEEPVAEWAESPTSPSLVDRIAGSVYIAIGKILHDDAMVLKGRAKKFGATDDSVGI